MVRLHPEGWYFRIDVETKARAARTYDLPVGQRVPGSRFVRSYCAVCYHPIRVRKPTRGDRCDDCCPEIVQRRVVRRELRLLLGDLEPPPPSIGSE